MAMYLEIMDGYIWVSYFTQDGYKEREDRIAELEEFINDQVTELDKMEAAMKLTVANKQLLEKDYQKITANKQLLEKDHEKLNEHYKNAKVVCFTGIVMAMASLKLKNHLIYSLKHSAGQYFNILEITRYFTYCIVEIF